MLSVPRPARPPRADFIGLDTCLSIMRVLHANLGEDKYRWGCRPAMCGWVGGGGPAVGCPVGLGWPLRWLLPCLLAPLTPALLFNVPAGPARCSCSTWMPAGWARRAGAGCTPTPDRMQRMWRCCCCVHYGARSHTRSNFLKNMLHLPGVAFLVLADDAFQPDAPAKFKWFSGAHGTPGPGGAEFPTRLPASKRFYLSEFRRSKPGSRSSPSPAPCMACSSAPLAARHPACCFAMA